MPAMEKALPILPRSPRSESKAFPSLLLVLVSLAAVWAVGAVCGGFGLLISHMLEIEPTLGFWLGAAVPVLTLAAVVLPRLMDRKTERLEIRGAWFTPRPPRGFRPRLVVSNA